MGTIRYEIVSGYLPVTVTLIGSGLPDNVHASYGQYSFTGMASATELLIVDNEGCTKMINVSKCLSCPDGFTSIVGGCEKEEILTPTLPTSPNTLVHNTNIRYGTVGTVVFAAGWNYNGYGSQYTRYNNGTFWANTGGYTNQGIMNINSVWSTTTADNQYIGFPICFNTVVEKTYYIGLGCDNFAEVKLDGVSILMQDTAALNQIFINNGWSIPNAGESTFRLWYIYPILISAGSHIIELIGHNTFGVASIGLDIYDMSETDLMSKNSYAEMGTGLIFSTKDEIGKQVLIGNLGQGYSCDAGYILGNCSGTPSCYKLTKLACGESGRATAWRPIEPYCISDVATTTTTIAPVPNTPTAPMSACEVIVVDSEYSGGIYSFNQATGQKTYRFGVNDFVMDVANSNTKLWASLGNEIIEYNITLNPFSYAYNRTLPAYTGAGLTVKSTNDATNTHVLVGSSGANIVLYTLNFDNTVSSETLFSMEAGRYVTGDIIYSSVNNSYTISTYDASGGMRITEYGSNGLNLNEQVISINGIYGLYRYANKNYALRSNGEYYEILPTSLQYVGSMNIGINGASQQITCTE